MDALLFPEDVGINVTANFLFDDAAIVALEGETVNWLFEEVTEKIVIGAVPLFVTVILSTLVEFAATFPKSFDVGDAENEGITPTPVTVAVPGEVGAS